MKVEVVSHCWRYPRLLAWQLSSLAAHSIDSVEITTTICHCVEDLETSSVLSWFFGRPRNFPPSMRWVLRPLERKRLMRRAIGRNLAAKATEADWVWFTDCDYLFGPHCLDSLPRALANVDGPLAFPETTMRSRTHALGDAMIERVNLDNLSIMEWDARDFTPEAVNRAIGGIQIVRGDYCRSHGYLDSQPKWQRPEKQWARTFEDAALRREMGTLGQPVHLPNLFRIRHSKQGRFHPGVQL
jgi:hypothetical protein